MEEYKSPAPEGGEEQKSKFSVWLENYWYHYKWHTIAALFVLLVLVVCTVQLCQRESYDVLVLYAGNQDISRTSKDGDVSEYAALSSALKSVVDDFDGDGEKRVGLEALFWMSSDQIREFEATKDEGDELSYSVIASNYETLNNIMMSNEYFVWFISEALYEYYVGMEGGDERFLPLDSLVDEGREVNYYVDKDGTEHRNAIYLADTGYYSLPGISQLPEDTVIVLRRTVVGASKTVKEEHASATEVVKRIINFD